MEQTLQLGFGVLCAPISEQLKEQGFKFDADKVKGFQRLSECIITLKFNDLLPDSQADKCRQKLFNKIKKHIAQKNKLHAKPTKNHQSPQS